MAVQADGFETPVRLGFKQFGKDADSILKTVGKTVKGLDKLSKPIKVDIKGFSKDINKVTGEVEKLEKSIDKLGKGKSRKKPLISESERNNLKGLGKDIDKVGLKADNLVRKQNLVNSVMRRTGVSAQVAGRAISIYAGNLDRAEREAFQLARGLGRAKDETNRLTDAQKRGNKVTSKGSSGLATLARRAATVALAYVGMRQGLMQVSQSTDVFLQLEDNLLGTQAVTNSTAVEMKGLSDQTRELGRSTRFTAIEVAKTQQILSRAGFSMRETISSLPSLLNFASAAQLDLNSATSIGADILRSFNKDVTELEHVLDVLAFAANQANTDVRLLSEGSKFAAPVFQATGQSVEIMSAALAALAERRLKGELGGTGLRIAIRSLIAPTKKATDALERMGIGLEEVDFVGENLIDVMNLLAEKNLSAQDSFKIFSARGGTAMLALTAGVGKFNQIYEDMGTQVDGTTKRMSDVIESGLGGSTRRLISAVESARIAFSEGYVPALMESQKRSIELLNTNEDVIRSFGELSGKVLIAGSSLLNWITGTTLVTSLSKDIDNITDSTEQLQKRWKGVNDTIDRGPEAIKKRLEDIQLILKRNAGFLKKLQGLGSSETILTGKAFLSRANITLRAEIEALEAAREGANIEAERAAEISREQAKAFAEEEKEAKAVALRVDAVAKATEVAKGITQGLKSETEKLTDKLDKAKNALDLGVLSLSDYNREVERLEGKIHDIEVSKLVDDIKELKGLLELTQPDIQITSRVDTREVDELEKRLDKELFVRIIASTGTPGISGTSSGLGQSADIYDPADDIAGIRQFGKEYKNQLTTAQKLANQFEGKWNDIAEAGIAAARAIGGEFGAMLERLIGGIDSILSGLDQVAAGKLQGGFGGALQQISGAAAVGGSIFQIGKGLGIFEGDKGTSQFGASLGGDESQMGATLGAIAGSFIPVIGTILGGVIGGVLGSFITHGAAEALLQLRQIGDEINAKVTEQEGGLGEIIQGMGDAFIATIEGIEKTLGADVILGGLGEIIGGEGLSGSGVSAAFKIRGDIVRVFINGLERDFATIEEALQFAVLEALKSATFGEGLGEEARKVLESGAFESVEELDIGLAVAKVLDEGTSGANQFTRVIDELNAEFVEINKVARQFNLSQEKVNQLYNDRLNLLKKDINLSLQSALGIQDRLGWAIEQEKAVNALNEALASNATGQQQELGLLRQREQALIAEVAITEESSKWLQKIRKDGFRPFIDEGERFIDTLTDTGTELANTRERIEDLERSLFDLPDSVNSEAIADAFNLAGRQTASDLGGILQEIMGQEFVNAELQKIAGLDQQARLAMQIGTTQLFLATATVLDDTVRSILETLVVEGNRVLQGLVDGSITGVGKVGRVGGGKRKQKLLEQARAAELAAEKLEDFNLGLDELILNASTASGTLGDLATRILDITTAGQEALDVGALASDVRRQQQLLLGNERRDLLDPFRDAAGTNFSTDRKDIERQRQDAIEQAKLLAQAEADLLGSSFEAVFAAMEAEINRGAKQMQNALVRAMVVGLGLPLEKVRMDMGAFGKRLKDLHLAFTTGAISEGRYLNLLAQIQAQQDQAVGGGALGLVDKYYKGIIDGEELRRTLVMANFDLELKMVELTFNRLVLEGALSQEIIDSVGGMLQFMKDNPPDWEKFFAGGPSDDSPGFRRSGGVPVTVITKATQGFESLLDSIRGFLTGFSGIDVGRFEAQAIDWLSSFEQFNIDIERAFGSDEGVGLLSVIQNLFGITDLTQLTADQIEQLQSMVTSTTSQAVKDLIELLTLGGDLDDALGQSPDKILNLYEGTLEVMNQLAAEYAALNDEYLDTVRALELLGGTAEDFARAEEIRMAQVEAFWERTLSGVRGLSEELRGGSLGGVSTRRRVDLAEDRVKELQARLEIDPLDFEALSEIEQAVRDFIDLQREFTGGVGPEFTLTVQEMLAFLDTIRPPDNVEPPSPEITSRMDEQTVELQNANVELATQNTHLLEMLQLTREQVTTTQTQHDAEISNQNVIGAATVGAIEGLGNEAAPPSD